MNLQSIEDYIGLIPPQHRYLEYFPQVVRESVRGPYEVTVAYQSWPAKFDFEVAVGHQLDILGEWIGFKRYLRIAINGIYFSWEGDPGVGWDLGYWKGPYDAETQVVSLGDEAYRRVLRAVMQINHWDGSYTTLFSIWNSFMGAIPFEEYREFDDDQFGSGLPNVWTDSEVWTEYSGTRIILIDHQDMTFSGLLFGDPLTGYPLALMKLGLNILKPSAVGFRGIFGLSTPMGTVFAWDQEAEHIAGWGLGEWPYDLDIGAVMGLGQDPNPIV